MTTMLEALTSVSLMVLLAYQELHRAGREAATRRSWRLHTAIGVLLVAFAMLVARRLGRFLP